MFMTALCSDSAEQWNEEADDEVDEHGKSDNYKLKMQIAMHDEVFDALVKEKQLGWQSEKVNTVWRQRNDGFALRENFSPTHKKYVAYYRQALSQLVTHVNGESVSVFPVRQTEPKAFLDIGCAPGGLCAYLTHDLGWTGVGFSLQPDDGGFNMTYSHDSLRFAFADVTKRDTYETVTKQLEEWQSDKFDFVNLGVVVSCHQVASPLQLRVLNLTACRNQFLLLLRWLRSGGNAMWVFSASKVGNWFYFLKKLQPLFANRVQLLPTAAPGRSQVYALFTSFLGTTLISRSWFDELLYSTVIADAQIALWRIHCWSHIGVLCETLKSDLHRIWNTQREYLERIRKGAEADCVDERLFSVLPTSMTQPSKFETSQSRADRDRNWRRYNPINHDGTGESLSSSKYHSEGFILNQSLSGNRLSARAIKGSSRADADLNWRTDKQAVSCNDLPMESDSHGRSLRNSRNSKGKGKADRDMDWRKHN